MPAQVMPNEGGVHICAEAKKVLTLVGGWRRIIRRSALVLGGVALGAG